MDELTWGFLGSSLLVARRKPYLTFAEPGVKKKEPFGQTVREKPFFPRISGQLAQCIDL